MDAHQTTLKILEYREVLTPHEHEANGENLFDLSVGRDVAKAH